MTGHGGRLGRVDTELAGAVLGAHGRRLVVLDPGGAGDDLVRPPAGPDQGAEGGPVCGA